jgi:Tol biopolymer transport system component
MPLLPGARLGPYEIVAAIGAGGMGEVYRGRDTRLDRAVAVKILPPALAVDPQLRERFEREARAMSQLTHPHICTLHDVGRDGDVDYLVLEFLEGETLEHRLAGGPLPFDAGCRIGVEIAEALAAAHRAGIVHRDLKPGNIMLAKSRGGGPSAYRSKLLDFGLAKSATPAVSGVGPSMLATTPPNLTAHGTILGTFQYMAPEQIEGAEADARTDIFALGCVLYEMFAGNKAFDGKTRASLIGSILKDAPPPVSQLVPLAPRSLDRLIAACLEKEPDARLQSAHDVAIQLRWIADGAAEGAVPSGGRSAGARGPLLVGATAAAALIAAAATWLLAVRVPEKRPITRFSVALPSDGSPTAHERHVMSVSPDGTRIVYVANQQLYLRALDQLVPVAIRGTEENPAEPVFSPDGEWIAYFARNTLKKIALRGGAVETLCDAQYPTGANWMGDRIVYGQGARGIFEESAAGGTPRLLVAPNANETLHGPQLLPGGRAVLFTSKPNGLARWDTAQIVVHELTTGARTTLVQGGSDGRYLAGYLLYVREGVLFATAMDARRLTTSDRPVAMLDAVAQTTTNQTGAAQFSASAAGTLVYLPNTSSGQGRTLVWRDRQGRETAINAPPRAYGAPRISPDGTRIAVDSRDQDNDIWIWDIVRQTLTRLTFGNAPDVIPLWTKDGRRILYSSNSGGTYGIFAKAADGTGSTEVLMKSPGQVVAQSLTADGSQAAVYPISPARVLMLSLDGKGSVHPLTATAPFTERNPAISADGRWIAYETDESGGYEIYVRPFPSVEQGRWQLSAGGGTRPLWAPDGRELYYVSNANRMMAVAVQPGPPLTFGQPMVIFDDAGAQPSPNRHYDIAPDGMRFVFIKEPPASGLPALVIVENWLAELKARVPAGR